MDETDKRLFEEENRKALIDLNTNMVQFGEALRDFNEKYVPPKDNVTVDGLKYLYVMKHTGLALSATGGGTEMLRTLLFW